MLDGSWLSGRRIYLSDAAVLIWLAAWLVIGVQVAVQVARLSVVAQPIVDVGSTMTASAQALARLGSLPFIGQDMSGISVAARHAASDAYATSGSIKSATSNLSFWFGFFIAAVPMALVLVIYLPGRIGRAFEVAAIRRAMRNRDPLLDEFLANRGLRQLPFRRLRRIGGNPWRDVAEGRLRTVADAELERLGIRRVG